LGSELELVTRGAQANREIVLRVFWQHFDDDDLYMEDVKRNWYEQEPAVFPGLEDGTLLTIRSLRTTWTEELVNRLYNGLARLISPAGGFRYRDCLPGVPVHRGQGRQPCA